jgi:hypothetical protein
VPPPSTRVAGIPRALDRLVLAATRRDPDQRPADAAAFLTAAREARVVADLPFSPVPPPTRSGAIPPPPRPLQGTRVVGRDDLDDLDDLDDEADDDVWDDDWDDEEGGDGEAPAARHSPYEDDADDDPGSGWDDEDEDDEPATRRAPRTGATVDDVDDRMERLERTRARRRSRRVFAVWVVGVGAATVAAGVVGWGLAVP